MVLNQPIGLNALRQDLNRLFYSVPVGASAPMAVWSSSLPSYYGFGFQAHYQPKANIAESPEATIITLELPGVELGQMTLAIVGNLLVCEGVRQPSGLIGNHMFTYNVAEGRFGSFRWQGLIPNGTVPSQIEATFRAGLLTIVLPRVATLATSPVSIGQPALATAPVTPVVINPVVNG